MAGLQGGSQAQRVPPTSTAADPPSLVSQVDRLEAQLAALSAAVGGRVAGAQQATREHLALFEGAVQELEGPARDAAARRDELLVAARRLATELRGLDFLAGHVKAVHELVKRLEGQVEQVVGAATLHRQHEQQQQEQQKQQQSPRQVQQAPLSPPRQQQ